MILDIQESNLDGIRKGLKSNFIPFFHFFNTSGGSAGGNMTATVALKLRDLKISPQPKVQVIMFPMTQAINFNLPSFVENEYDPLLYKELTVAMWLMYATGMYYKNVDLDLS